jgi:ABC-type transport system involved in multi-copper enzyme maturation permease subunit
VNWFVWRQHRKQFLILGLLLVAFAALVIPTGLSFWHTYQQALTACAQNPATPSCSDLPGNLFQSSLDQILFRLVPVSVLILPVILGMFWGAPLLAKEYSEGTNSLIWTQSVSRRKWLTIKLAWILVATVVFAGAFAALSTWWSNTPNALYLDRFNGIHFGSQDIVPVAESLFAVALGIMVGAWFRKTMLAVGVALGLSIALVLVVVPNFVRPNYMTPNTVTSPMGPGAIDAKIPSGSNLLLTRNIVDKNGKTFDRFNSANLPPQCQQLIEDQQVSNNGHSVQVMPGKIGTGSIDACLNDAGYHQIAKYQPASRYWDFQDIEAGLYLVLSALAITATYGFVLKRDA